MKKIILLLTLFFLNDAKATFEGEIMVRIDATIDSVADPINYLENTIFVGDSLTGYYRYAYPSRASWQRARRLSLLQPLRRTALPLSPIHIL